MPMAAGASDWRPAPKLMCGTCAIGAAIGGDPLLPLADGEPGIGGSGPVGKTAGGGLAARWATAAKWGLGAGRLSGARIQNVSLFGACGIQARVLTAFVDDGLVLHVLRSNREAACEVSALFSRMWVCCTRVDLLERVEGVLPEFVPRREIAHE